MSGRRISIASGLSVDRIAAEIASQQRGRVSRQQLLSVGAETGAIGRRLRGGRLTPEHAGVYVVGHGAAVELGEETSALLACGPLAMLADHSATTLWGMRVGRARPIHVLVPEGHHGPQPAGVIVHRSRILAPRDVAIRNDLPVTSPARTILDIAATLPERDLAYVLEDGLRNTPLTEGAIHEILSRAGRHPGVHALSRLMLDRTGALTESVAQQRLFELIRDAGLPAPETEVPLLGYRADLFWRDLNLVVEVDGYGAHGTRGSFERDRRKDARLMAAGFTVIRFTARQIEHEPLMVIATLAQLIHAARQDPSAEAA